MQVHRQNSIRAGGLDQVGNQSCRDGHSRLVFLVAAPVGVVRHDRSDTARRRPLGGIHHYQQLHQVVVHGRAYRLDYENIPFADVLKNPDERIIVGEFENFDIPLADSKVVAYIGP